MKILVTGGAGFIGSNFIFHHLNKNCNIVNFDKITYAASNDTLKLLSKNKNYELVLGDIINRNKINEIINKFKPTYIVNFAAESHVDRSISDHIDFINTNIIGTYTILEEALKYYNKLNDNNKNEFKYLQISTDEVYGSLNENEYFTENSQYKPSSPYSASKASADHLVTAWGKTFGLPIIITNCSNNYGPFQFPEKLIPLMIIRALEKRSLPIYGDGKNIRDWIHVTDHCEAISSILKKGRIGETYLIGANNELTNTEIVTEICNKISKIKSNGFHYSELIQYVKDRPGHDYRYAIDNKKIRNEIGWSPKINFKQGILETIHWYINNDFWWKNIQKNKYNQERLGL